MSGFSYTVAYLGGLLTLFSPCSALLIPSFFAYAFNARTTLASRTFVFFLGLLSGLVPLGAALGSAGRFLSSHIWQITFWGGLLIIILGVVQLFGLPMNPVGFLRDRFSTSGPGNFVGAGAFSITDRTSALGVFLLGFTYGLAGTGCSGPIIGAISSFVITQASSWQGGLLMSVYAAGMFTPVVILAFIWDSLPAVRGLLRPRPLNLFGRQTTLGNVISGFVFIALGSVMAFLPSGSLSTSVLSASAQADLENQVRLAVTSVPNWLFILAAVLVLAIIFVLVYQRYRLESSSDTKEDVG